MSAFHIKARIHEMRVTPHDPETLAEIRDEIERIAAIGQRLELYQLIIERMLK